MEFFRPGGNGMELASSDAMAARDALPVLRGPLFLWRATPFPFLKEKRKWGRKTQADEYPQGAGRICNAPSSRTAALGIGPYRVRCKTVKRADRGVRSYRHERSAAEDQAPLGRGASFLRKVA